MAYVRQALRALLALRGQTLAAVGGFLAMPDQVDGVGDLGRFFGARSGKEGGDREGEGELDRGDGVPEQLHDVRNRAGRRGRRRTSRGKVLLVFIY